MKLSSWLGIALALALFTNARGEEDKKADRKTELKVEEILTGLNNPTGIAIPINTTDAVYVAESGAGRVILANPGKPGTSQDVITGFSLDNYGPGPSYKVGPLGLSFLDRQTLIVGDGSQADGEELVRIYTLPKDGKALPCAETTYTLGPFPKGDGTETGEGNFYGVVTTDTAIFVTANGDDKKGWILRSELDDEGIPIQMELYIPTKSLTKVDAPVGITTDPLGHVVVGQCGEISGEKDSLLTFYQPTTGSLIMSLPTGLYDIVGLAYCPTSGLLYAVDFAWNKNGEGGLYRLDRKMVDGRQSIDAVKLLSLKKPTACAFAAQGDDVALYVTEMGDSEGGKPAGRLLKITGKL